MIICPADLQRCQRTECRHGRCALSERHPLVECTDCGALLLIPVAYGICIECIKTYHFPERRT